MLSEKVVVEQHRFGMLGHRLEGEQALSHQHMLCPARVPGLRPRAGQGLGLC